MSQIVKSLYFLKFLTKSLKKISLLSRASPIFLYILVNVVILGSVVCIIESYSLAFPPLSLAIIHSDVKLQ